MTIAPPRPKGPPLNALRAFEAAARHQNFSLAAAELSVTPGAVAQHVKQLEAWIGRSLFARSPHGVRLTPNGRAALDKLTLAFDALGDAVHDLRRLSVPTDLRIAALPSVAQLWLLPRLPALRRAFPKLTISVVAMEQPPNLTREPYDLALFFAEPDAKHVHATLLARSDRFPVCTPKIARRLKSPSDLAHETLLHDATWRDDWERWLAAAGANRSLADAGPVYSLYSLAAAEAVNGAGILLANEPLVEALLRSGELVRPFKMADRSQPPLTATVRAAGADLSVDAVVAWLASSARRRP